MSRTSSRASVLGGMCLTAWMNACDERTQVPLPRASFGETPLTREQLLDPQACQGCHPSHFTEWSGSMHAYASKDPVFVAMNALGQQQTEGKLGTFCVNCHAPMAVADGLTKDGLDLAELPAGYQGVTCYFCHNIESVDGEHNNPLHVANDATLRGPFRDPAVNPAHLSRYSEFMDSGEHASARLCGACHDVVLEAHHRGPVSTGNAVALERTFQEWKATLFNRPANEGGLTCNGCHMPISATRNASSVGEQMPLRSSRRHDFEGVDAALVPFPGQERQRLLTQQFLDSSLLAEVCVSRDGLVAVTLENSAGHHWPSGATFDRLAWLEVRAFTEAGLVFQTVDPESVSSERLGLDGGALDAMTIPGAGGGDAGPITADPRAAERNAVFTVSAPSLTETVVKPGGEEAHFFWEIEESTGSTALPGVVTRDPLSPDYHVERRTWRFDTNQAAFASLQEVQFTVRLRPIKLAILSDLVGRGQLAADIAARVGVLSVLPQRCYSAAEAQRHPDILGGVRSDCDDREPKHATTLTWTREQARAGNRNFRGIVLDGAPAACLAHSTYIPPGP